mgnify:CR=1 FL=1
MLNLKVDLARPEVCLPAGDAWLHGDLVLPPGIQGLVLFAHGSAIGHHSERCRQVARHLKHANIGTLLFDLLTERRFSRHCEDVLHHAGTARLLLPQRDHAALRSLVALQRLQRASGVIYRPDTKRRSYYFYTRFTQQFNAVMHIDETRAMQPLDVGQVWSDGEAAETIPSRI